MSEHLPDVVGDNENIARYLLENSKFTASTGNVRHHAFMPKALKTSVYRIDDCSESEVWSVGQEFIGDPQSKSVLARADFIASHIFDIGLAIKPDVSPHPRHATIEGWPTEKGAQKLKAMEMLKKVTLIVNPNSEM